MCARGASETQPLGRSMDRSRWSLGIRFFLRQALLDRLRGDPVSKGADLELVVAEDVGVVSAGEIGGEFANLVIDGLADCLGEVLDLVTSLRRRWGRRHGASIPKGVDFPSAAHFPCCVQKIHQLSRRPPTAALQTAFFLTMSQRAVRSQGLGAFADGAGWSVMPPLLVSSFKSISAFDPEPT